MKTNDLTDSEAAEIGRKMMDRLERIKEEHVWLKDSTWPTDAAAAAHEHRGWLISELEQARTTNTKYFEDFKLQNAALADAQDELSQAREGIAELKKRAKYLKDQTGAMMADRDRWKAEAEQLKHDLKRAIANHVADLNE